MVAKTNGTPQVHSTDAEKVKYEPISRLPRKVPSTPAHIFYPKLIFFVFATLFFSSILVVFMLPSLLLLAIRHPLRALLPGSLGKKFNLLFYRGYKYYVRAGQIAFGSYLVTIISFYVPGTFVITGDTDEMAATKHSIVISNHQIYPDWFYLWILAYFHGHHGDVKIMLMDVIKFIPVLGIGIVLFEFILMKRKLALDRSTVFKMMSRQRNYIPDFPMWLLLFPEGTLNTPNNRVTSRAFAKKNDIPFDPAYIILPKAMGLFMCCDLVGSEIDSLFDITMGYGGLEKEDIPYEEYLVENCFGHGKHPKEIHFHIKKFNISELPGFNDPSVKRPSSSSASGSDLDVETETKRRDAFSLWLRNRFMEKDQLMDYFYKTGSFPSVEYLHPKPESNGVTNWFPDSTKKEKDALQVRKLKQVKIKLASDWTDWVIVLAILLQGYYTVPVALRWLGYLLWLIPSVVMGFIR